MFEVAYKPHFQKKYQLLKQELTEKQFKEIAKTIKLLATGIKLPGSYRNHPRKAFWEGTFGCHIPLSDIVIMYEKDKNLLTFLDLGHHDEIF